MALIPRNRCRFSVKYIHGIAIKNRESRVKFQFVPFRDYIGGGRNQVLSQARLAKDVLQEIPDQFVDYMKKRNLRPREQPPEYSVR